ncbi:MAG: thiamine phosphate synthase, partial [Dongiaceae bacterium]
MATPRLGDVAEGERIAAALSEALGAADVASLLLRRQAGLDPAALRPTIDRLRSMAQERGVAVLVEERVDLVKALGVDGVHLAALSDYRDARRSLGPDLIVGVGSAARDEAMTAAEAGADYVAFGDFDDGSPTEATLELTDWWGALMTVPCVAAGCTGPDDAALLRDAGADFIAIGAGLWADPARL